MLSTPIYKHAGVKPNGYAGDAVLMKYIYKNDYQGNCFPSKIFHKWVCLL